MVTTLEVRDRLEQAAQDLTALPVGAWAGRATYFLETLECYAQAKDVDPRPVLETIRADLAGQIELGRW